MRAQGHYIVDKRLKFKKGLQRKFIYVVKRGSNKTWNELSKRLNVHPYTIRRDWYTENNTIPKFKAIKLYNIYPFTDWRKIMKGWVLEELHPQWGQRKGGGHNRVKIKTPTHGTELAEFLGSALGDGSLDKYVFTLSCDTTQANYTRYIEDLVKNLFSIKCKIFLNPSNKNNIFLKVYSAELITYLQKQGLTIGNKIQNRASLPTWIFKDANFASAALRGLFDTDGGIYEKQKGYERAIIEFQTKSPYIHRDILRLLKVLEFNASKGDDGLNIRIQNQEEIHRFFKIIGSSNIKNVIRYKEFIRTGVVPNRDRVINLMRNYPNNRCLPFKIK